MAYPKTATLTHKVRNPQNIDEWLNIWKADVTRSYDAATNDYIENSENIIISPSEQWEIPVNQIIPYEVIVSNDQIEEKIFYQIYKSDDTPLVSNDYTETIDENNIKRIEEEMEQSFYYVIDNDQIFISNLNSNDWTIETYRAYLDETNENYEDRYVIVFTTQKQESKTETLYNATVQIAPEENLKGQIAVFSEQGLLVPLGSSEGQSTESNTEEDSTKNKFLTSNNEWKLPDEYQLESKYINEKEILQSVIEFFNQHKDEENNYIDIDSLKEKYSEEEYDEFENNFNIFLRDEYFEPVGATDENDNPIIDDETNEQIIAHYILRPDIIELSNSNLPPKVNVSLSSFNPNENNISLKDKGSFSLVPGTYINLEDKTIENSEKPIYQISNSLPQFGRDITNTNTYHAGYIGNIPNVNAKYLAYGIDENGNPGWYSLDRLTPQTEGWEFKKGDPIPLASYTNSTSTLTFTTEQIVTDVRFSNIVYDDTTGHIQQFTFEVDKIDIKTTNVSATDTTQKILELPAHVFNSVSYTPKTNTTNNP